MVAFVVGHGSYQAVGRSTFVPRGVEVHFHADADTALPITLGMRVIATGGAAGARQRFGELAVVPNYELAGLTDPQRASYAQVDPENGTVYVVGDQLPSPILMCDGDATSCPPAGGRHGCRGILGRLADKQPIHLVTCRVEEAAAQARAAARQPEPYTGVVGSGEGDPVFHAQMRKLWVLFNERLTTDPAEAAQLFDGLRETDRTYLLQNPAVRNWSYLRQARRYEADHGAAALYRFYVSQPEDVRKVIDADPALAGQVTRVRELLKTFPDANQSEAARVAAWSRLSHEQRTSLMAADASGWIYQWATRPGSQPAGDLPAGTPGTATPPAATPGAGQPAKGQPGAAVPDWPAVDRHNGAVLRGAAYGQRLPFVQAGDRLLLGADTSYWHVAQHLAGRPGYVRGEVVVFKPTRSGDPAGSGWLRVTGCTDTPAFTAAMARVPAEMFAADVTFAPQKPPAGQK